PEPAEEAPVEEEAPQETPTQESAAPLVEATAEDEADEDEETEIAGPAPEASSPPPQTAPVSDDGPIVRLLNAITSDNASASGTMRQALPLALGVRLLPVRHEASGPAVRPRPRLPDRRRIHRPHLARPAGAGIAALRHRSPTPPGPEPGGTHRPVGPHRPRPDGRGAHPPCASPCASS